MPFVNWVRQNSQVKVLVDRRLLALGLTKVGSGLGAAGSGDLAVAGDELVAELSEEGAAVGDVPHEPPAELMEGGAAEGETEADSRGEGATGLAAGAARLSASWQRRPRRSISASRSGEKPASKMAGGLSSSLPR